MERLAASNKTELARNKTRGAVNLPENVDSTYGLGGLPDFIYRKASCACGGGCPACLAGSDSLNVSQPGDQAEVEADRVADEIMRIPTLSLKDEPKMAARVAAGESAFSLHRKALPSAANATYNAVNHVQKAVQSGGRPLDERTRQFFEPRIGYDLSSVRLHMGESAAQSAHALQAKAYALGSDIVFGENEYTEGSVSGNRLLAHELAHVTGNHSGIHRDPKPDAVVDPVEVRLEGLPTDGLKLMAKAERKDANIIDKEKVMNGDLVLPEFGVNDNQGKVWAWINVPDKSAIDVPVNRAFAKARGFNYPILHGFIEFKYLGNITIPITIYAKPPVKVEPPAPISVAPPKRDKPTPPEAQSAKDLISQTTSLSDLKEDALGKKLLEYADGEDFATADSVLEELGNSDRDDVSFEMTQAASDDQLAGMAETAAGRKFLDRLYDEITSGPADEKELAQAERILMAKAGRINPKKFMNADKYAMVIPFSASGFTKFNSASLSVYRMDNGNIWVRSHMKTEHWQNAKLSPEHYSIMYSGMEMDPDTIVGVYLYDEGGKIVYMPALYLLQLSNTDSTKVGMMAGEAFVAGLTLGLGGEAVAVGETANASRAAIWGARAFTVLNWTDRAATVFAAASTLINDHRGWIIEKFGDEGSEFLKDWAKVDRILMIYGLARGAVALGQMGYGLRASWKNWRTSANKLEDLAEDEKKIVDDLSSNVEQTLEEIDAAQAKAGMGAKAAPANVAGQADDAAEELTVINKNDPVVAANNAEDVGAEVVDLDRYRKQQAAKKTVKQTAPAQQLKKTGTDDTVAVAQDSSIAANDNVEMVDAPSTSTSTRKSGGTATVTPIKPRVEVDFSEFPNGTDLTKNKWIGKKWKPGDDLPKGYVPLKDGGIRRGPGFREKNFVPLEVKDGKLAVGTAGERISNPSVMNRNYKSAVGQELRAKNPGWTEAKLEAELIKEVEKNSVHHLIPDNVVQDHPLAQAATKAGYSLDNAGNLKGLPKSKVLTDIEAGEMGHWTSHPQYDRLVKDELDTVQKALEKEFKSLDKVPQQRLLDALKGVEDKLRKLIEDGKAPIKDGHLAEDEPRAATGNTESYA